MSNTSVERYFLRETKSIGTRKRNHTEFHANYIGTQITHIEILEGSYFQPHSHLLDKRGEYLLLLSGVVRFFVFTDDGCVERSSLLGKDVLGVYIPFDIVHTIVVESPKASLLDIKEGPYIAETAKLFPKWSISENCDHILLEQEINRWQNEANSLR